MPVRKNGSADARYIAVSRRKLAAVKSNETGTWSTISRTKGMRMALIPHKTVASRRVWNRPSQFFAR